MFTRKDKIYIIIGILLSIVPFIISSYYYNVLPDEIPTHFSFSGTPDKYESKNVGLFMPSSIMFFVLIFSVFLNAKDPKRANQSKTLLHIIYIFIPVLTIFLNVYTIRYSLGYREDLGIYIIRLMSIFFIFIGNLLPKLKRNYTMGIKLPWTLNSDNNWNKTHRLAGYLWTGINIIVLILSFILKDLTKYIFFVGVFIMCILPAVYSYMIYEKEKRL